MFQRKKTVEKTVPNLLASVFLVLLWNLSLLHSVSGCPERCKCSPHGPSNRIISSTLLWGTLSPSSDNSKNISVICNNIGLVNIQHLIDLDDFNPNRIISL